MRLSILICTLPERVEKLKRLINELVRQKTYEVEVLTDNTPRGQITTGEKRNNLLRKATGDYIVFIDDDDWIPVYYVDKLLKAIESNPDSVGFEGYVTNNDSFDKYFLVGQQFKEWSENEEYYYRNTNHICPVKREIALKCMFPNKTIGEDFEYSQRLKKHLKTEVFIDDHMYFYHVQSKH